MVIPNNNPNLYLMTKGRSDRYPIIAFEYGYDGCVETVYSVLGKMVFKPPRAIYDSSTGTVFMLGEKPISIEHFDNGVERL